PREAVLDEASYGRRPTDIGRFVERVLPPDPLPGDAQGERRLQRDGGREIRARVGVSLAERRGDVERPGVIAPAEAQGDPTARGPRLVAGVETKVRRRADLAQVVHTIRARDGNELVGFEVGMRELEHRAHGETRRL